MRLCWESGGGEGHGAAVCRQTGDFIRSFLETHGVLFCTCFFHIPPRKFSLPENMNKCTGSSGLLDGGAVKGA